MHPIDFVDMIDAIGIDGEITTTELARRLGITKGAVSQTTSKLLDKEFIQKGEITGYNEVNIVLTDSGRLAFEGHRKLHETMRTEVDKIMHEVDDHTMRVISEILSAIDKGLDKLEETENDI